MCAPTPRRLHLRVTLLLCLLTTGACTVASSKGDHPPRENALRWDLMDPPEVVRTYWALSMRGEVEQAQTYEINTDGRVVVMSGENYSMAETIHRYGLELRDIRDVMVRGDKAQLVAEVINSNGTTNTMQHNLYRENGRWKILSIYSVNPLMCKHLPEMCTFIEK